MKSLNLVLLLTLFVGAAIAQTTKGSWMLGSTVGVSHLGYGQLLPDNHAGVTFLQSTVKSGDLKESQNLTYTAIAPGVGYFVIDNLMLGLNVNYGFTKVEGETNTQFTAAPKIRYYFNSNSKIRFLAEVQGGTVFEKYEGEEKNTLLLLGARAGAARFVNDHVSLDLFVDYLYLKDKEPELKSNAFGVGVGLSFFL